MKSSWACDRSRLWPWVAAASLVLSCLAATLFPAGALAADDAEALIQKGVALRKRGQDHEALEYFRKAHAMSPTPRATAQLGLVNQALGRWTQAEGLLEKALATKGDPWLEKNRAVLDEQLRNARTHIAQIDLTGDPAGAEIIVNGQTAGRLPLAAPIRVGEGFAEVELRAEGHTPEKRTLTLKGGYTQQLFVKLTSITSVDAEPARVAVREQAPEPGRADEKTSGDTAAPAPGRALRIGGIVVAVAGVAGIGFGVSQSLRVRELNMQEVEKGSPEAEEGASASRRQWVGYGLGTAGLVGGALMYWLGAKEGAGAGSSASTLPPSLVLVPGGAAALLSGRF